MIQKLNFFHFNMISKNIFSKKNRVLQKIGFCRKTGFLQKIGVLDFHLNTKGVRQPLTPNLKLYLLDDGSLTEDGRGAWTKNRKCGDEKSL